MKELTVRECEAVSGSGLADLFRPGTGNVSPPVTPEKTGGTLIIGGGIGFGFGFFPFMIGKFIGGMIKIPF
ncbi:hypothetical protein [Morganella morganii]|uniref:hypothetical protein n=1 Tax=Morganella morganii TaxID=582 RepID=UPI001BDB0BEA|nr:hypothetical protein [Morganella morganii]MBT0519224.1 hypothetical protein [Morganella morganii subsp. morganii]MDR5685480.1 hypothetical protein [Morganella morganii]QWL88395.1 hypothetical protein IZ187_12505 [Morganella morganii subsp. morganii]HEI8569719.1 hypothetical protein [Morganella morganii]